LSIAVPRSYCPACQTPIRAYDNIPIISFLLLGGKCRICGYDRCPAALDFHHTDPLGKDFNISASTSPERILREIQKCELLCSRCHREVHAGLHPQYLADDDTYRMLYDEIELVD
jgi:hypothetical protein